MKWSSGHCGRRRPIRQLHRPSRLVQKITAILYSLNTTYEAGLYFADVLEFHTEATNWITPPTGDQANSDQDDTTSRTAQRGQLHGPITVDRVSFTYPGEASPALSEVSLTIKHGETVAFVGENGSGKITLAKLLAGLYLPEAGSVTWDGTDLSDADREAWRACVAVIAQDYCRWPATARLNVTMTPGLDHERFDHAVRISGADDVVDALPDGWDSLLDKRFTGGHELSGGQWQRLAVARGLHKKASLLICDEPTSALDAKAEHAIIQAMTSRVGRPAGTESSPEMSTVLITHRLASVRHAHRIYVLDKGHVVEHGTHDQLIELDGTYAHMFGLQAAAYQHNRSAGATLLDAPEPGRERTGKRNRG